MIMELRYLRTWMIRRWRVHKLRTRVKAKMPNLQILQQWPFQARRSLLFRLLCLACLQRQKKKKVLWHLTWTMLDGKMNMVGKKLVEEENRNNGFSANWGT